jgi:GNAT superfamily N-acetyltransferase
MSLQIRPATLADAAQVHAITQSAFAPYVGVIIPTPNGCLEQLPAVEADCQNGAVRVALWEGEIVGALRLDFRADHLHLRRIAVLPAFQGRGIAGALIRAAEAEGRAAGLKQAKLETRYSLPENWRRYMRLGYAITRMARHPGGPDITVGLTKQL